MKIGNAFSLNMVQLPASWSAQKIYVEQIKTMVMGKAVNAMATELKNRDIRSDDDDGFVYIWFAGQKTSICWSPGDDLEQKIQALSGLGLETTEMMYEAVFAAIYDDVLPEGDLESVIGHADTARIVSDILGVELPANRATVKLEKGEKMIVAQYSGPRLPEGATSLPEGAKIEFVLVEVN